MAHPAWRLSGDYFETCSCDFVCPCIPSNLSGRNNGHFAPFSWQATAA